MTRTRALVAAAVLSTTALACEVILGIKNDDFRVADAEAIPDPCVHALPPPPPPADAGDIGPTLAPLVFAFEHSRLDGRDDAGRPVGYDLDGVCTCDTRPGSARGGVQSCIPHDPDAGACDDDGGVDNVPAVNFPPSLAASLDAVFLEQAQCGRQTMLVQLSDYNGRTDDPQVVVALAPSYGIFDPHDGGEDLDAAKACGPEDGGGNVGPTAGYPAKLDGTDIWSVESASVAQGILRDRFQGYVTNGTLVVKIGATGDGLGGWSMVVGGRVIPVRTAILTARVNKHPDGTYRLDDGLMTGRLAVDDLISTVGSLRVQVDEYVCGHPELYLPIKSLVCASPDLAKLPSADFTSTRCDAVSLVFQFRAGPAAVGHAEPPQTLTPPGCGRGWVDSCGSSP